MNSVDPHSQYSAASEEKHEDTVLHKTGGLKFVPLDEASLRRNDEEQRERKATEMKPRFMIRIVDRRKAK